MSFSFSGLIINDPSQETLGTLRANDIKYLLFNDPARLILIETDSQIYEKFISIKISEKVLFLEFDTWAGSIDLCRGHYIVNGFINNDSKIEVEYPNAEIAFRQLFSGINLEINNNCYFKPFNRHE